MTRIAIADDQKLFRRGLRLILSNDPELEVIFEAEDGVQLLKRLSFEPVDIVILDVEMPNMDGVEALKAIRKDHPNTRVIMLTMHDSDRLILQLMELGANGFLLKDEDPAVVLEAISTVVKSGIFFRDYVSKALLQNRKVAVSSYEDSYSSNKLSDREMEILYLLCKEYTSKEVGERLFISTRTVEGHRRNIQEKIGARNLAGMVMYAVNNGII